MYVRKKLSFFVLFLCCIFIEYSTCVEANTAFTHEEWVDFALNKLEVTGLTEGIFSSSKPHKCSDIINLLINIRQKIESGEIRPSPLELEIIKKLEREFDFDKKENKPRLKIYLFGEADYESEWVTRSVSLWSAGYYKPIQGLELYEEIEIARDKEITGQEGETASRRTNYWEWNYTADFKRAYINMQKGPFEVLFGRDHLYWGPGSNGSLIISDNSPAFDMIMLKAEFGVIQFLAFSAMLDKMWAEHGNPPTRYLANRYLSGHRMDWLVNKRLQLGLSEVVLYGGDNRGIELQYLNPLIPYYATQWNSTTIRRDDNVLTCADFALRPFDGIKIYGQFLVDDFSYSGGDPHALGYIGGIYFSDLMDFSGIDLMTEYTRIDSWTYTHLEQDKQYTHYGWIIGHELGPDAEQMLIKSIMIYNPDARLETLYKYSREGSRKVADRFKGEDYKNINFPSGNVQSKHIIGIRVLWEKLYGQRLDISLNYIIQSQGSDRTNENEINFEIGLAFGIK
ncbi:hypothetical protein GF312_05795 [Candidatus Poribacteria bacterium]|nr:hypothetical protein [Candidatus Poribacteria bacterium]